MGLVPSALDEGHYLGMTHALNVYPVHLHRYKGRIIRSAALLGALIISSLDFILNTEGLGFITFTALLER